MTSPDQLLVGYYDYRAVALSVLIAVLGSYSTIELGGRVTAARGWYRLSWLTGGAMAMGIGTWSMHYTGMLAFQLPVQVLYHWPTALVSFLASVFSSVVALFVISRRRLGWLSAIRGSVFMGGGIVALHYIAMESMRLPAMCSYSSPLVTLSVLIAIVFSLMCLWLTFFFREGAIGPRLRKVGSALFLGAAISAMHYTAMASARFWRTEEVPDLTHSVQISFLDTVGIGVLAVMVLAVALVTSLTDRLLKRTALLDELFEQAPQAVALTNGDNRVVRVNREFTRIFGNTSEETLGRRLSELIVPDDSLDEDRRITDLVARGQRVDVECVRQRKDNSRLPVAMVKVPVLLPDGQISVYEIYHDITERKQAEEQLKATSEQLRAFSESLRSAREEEGTRIAREIHDELGSALTSLKWDLEGIEELCTESASLPEASKLGEKIKGMMGLIDGTLNAVIRISSELRPSILDDLGLLAAIEWQAQQFEARAGIACHFDSFTENVDLSHEQETAVFRIVQEALTNVLRHAKATRVNIIIEEDGGEFALEVRDNGIGITEQEKTGLRSLGLMSMRERANLVGGAD